MLKLLFSAVLVGAMAGWFGGGYLIAHAAN
jgi:hypothetical protein